MAVFELAQLMHGNAKTERRLRERWLQSQRPGEVSRGIFPSALSEEDGSEIVVAG